MEINIKGSPGTGNSFTEVKIQNVESYNPNATSVTVNHNYYSDKKGSVGTAEDKDVIDPAPIREEIINYVSRVRPLLKDEWKSGYIKMWNGILDLDAISGEVYKVGKQQGTNFNRALVANILHYLDSRQIYREPYSSTKMAVALEHDKDHSVRGHLAKDPSEEIMSRLGRFFETFEL